MYITSGLSIFIVWVRCYVALICIIYKHAFVEKALGVVT